MLEFVHKCLLATHELSESGYVVGHVEGIVPRTAFVKSRIGFEVRSKLGIERREELSRGKNGPQRAIFGTVVVAVTERTLAVALRVVLFA